ncbi:hypothetical protein EGR_09613 [Echinococcus granulosus]|uniref:Uncharacterized protein n=1 Tax=Echinococcus granulosus TaxID=6210 RepID=W6U365_ECHGR|nr:hypothetical protein EGR_09613 [Echinococcus granulosus]EUB55543.1 hypothetical protein EGR_09613 [Echinococcus granulosus]
MKLNAFGNKTKEKCRSESGDMHAMHNISMMTDSPVKIGMEIHECMAQYPMEENALLCLVNAAAAQKKEVKSATCAFNYMQ